MTIWMSLVFGYLAIGAVVGPVHEELNYRRSSHASRAPVDYIFFLLGKISESRRLSWLRTVMAECPGGPTDNIILCRGAAVDF